MYSTRRGFTDDERERLAATIDAVYADFVAKVAEGRRRPVAEIEALARGRVWTGSDALGIGLVDELGGLRDAVRIARERGGLPEPTRRCGRRSTSRRWPGSDRPKNSEDPRAAAARELPGLGGLAAALEGTGLGDLATALGLPPAAALRMPAIHLR